MKKGISLVLAVVMVAGVKAQDRFFAHTYNSNVLPKGNIDLELWHTSRIGHNSGYFHAMDQRMELEVGLGKNVQTAFYFNRYQSTFSNSLDELQHTNEIGFSNEWKWKLSDPSANALGTALYGEWGVKGDEIEWEGKLIMDKYVGKNLFAFNLVGELEQEIEKENGKFELEQEATPVELDFAYMRNFNQRFGAGIEVVNYNDIVKGNWNSSALFAGPTVNYRSDRWFVIANYLPQWTNLHKTAAVPGNKVLDEHERAEARVIVGFSF